MNESDFDVRIKRLLAEAEEPVSPSVWKGVERSLDRGRRIVPLWVWRSVGVAAAAAAAVAVGVFLFRPQAEPTPVLAEQTAIPALTEQIAASEMIAEVQEPEITPVAAPAAASKPARKAAVIPQAVTAPAVMDTPAATDEPLVSDTPAVAETPVITETPVETHIASETQETQTAADESAEWARILSEEQPAARQGMDISVFGNLQDRFRSNASGRALRRAPASTTLAPTESGIYWENPEYRFSIPFTAGIGLRFRLTDRWSIGTGFQYTYMSRSFLGDYVELDDDGVIEYELKQTDIQNMQHWIGIPLNVYFDIVPKGRWNFYTFLGGSVEYLASNRHLVHTPGNDIRLKESGKGVQPSIGGGVGISFQISPSVGLYFDPSIRYYFDTKQPRSIRTIQPLRMDLEAGVRFTL